MRSLDHKEISIWRNEKLEDIAAVYLHGREVNVCKHVVNGVLPRIVHIKALTEFDVAVRGDVEHGTHLVVFPSVFICADCLTEFLANAGGERKCHT